MIEFKQIEAEGSSGPIKYPVDRVFIDGEFVGYWGKHDGADMTLLNGLDPSDSEQQRLDEACVEYRGFKPKIVVQPKRRAKG